jgi:hypothetical protein
LAGRAPNRFAAIGVKRFVRSDRERGGDQLAAELRRLRRATASFLACLAVVVALLAIGLYH